MEKLKEMWASMSLREKILLGVAVVGVAGYALYKRSQAASNQTATGSQNPSDLFGNDMYAAPSGSLPPAPSPTPPGTQPPTPAPTPLKGPPIFYTTRKGDTIEKIYLSNRGKAGYWGDASIKAKNPNLQNYGYNTSLPAGLQIQVGGPQVGTTA